jgi:hypothetical protein
MLVFNFQLIQKPVIEMISNHGFKSLMWFCDFDFKSLYDEDLDFDLKSNFMWFW